MKVQRNDITHPRLQNDFITFFHNVIKLVFELALILPQRECTQKQFIIHKADNAERGVEMKIMAGGDWRYIYIHRNLPFSRAIDLF